MERSESVKELAAALSKAQAEFKTIPKKKTATIKMRNDAGTYTYMYADLADVLEVIREPLAKNGLAICQSSNTIDTVAIVDNKNITKTSLVITTMLVHSSGEWIKNELRLPVVETGNTIQSIGSSVTYGRRYEVCAILGVSSEEDADAAAAAKKKTFSAPAQKGDDILKKEYIQKFANGREALKKLTGSDKEFFRVLGDNGWEDVASIPVGEMPKIFKLVNNKYAELKDAKK